MKFLNRFLENVHQKLPSLAAVFLMLPVLILAWFVAKEPFLSVASGDLSCYVLSGKLFSENFNTIHAGSGLDQPTIGKWLFWFSVMALLSLPYATTVRWICRRGNIVGYLAYVIPVILLCVFLLCILSWPICWLIQYVHSMGFTPRKVCGLIYGVAGCAMVIGFLFRAIRKPKNEQENI